MHHRYFIKTPWIVKKIFSSYVWDLPVEGKEVFLTFDDGPHPEVTTWVLDELRKYQAPATFFCIGDNVQLHPQTYEQVLREGHAIGNHTQHHPNGWHTDNEVYLGDVAEAAKRINSNLFRPPYGRIKAKQAGGISKAMQTEKAHIIMWDVLSCDFDTEYSPQQCLDHVIDNVVPGSIIVFHDSEKAFPNLRYALQESLKILSGQGFSFRKIVL